MGPLRHLLPGYLSFANMGTWEHGFNSVAVFIQDHWEQYEHIGFNRQQALVEIKGHLNHGLLQV